MTSPDRREILAANLAVVRERIAAACASAGRAPEEVTLTVVTKFFPAGDVRLLVDLGVRDVGENRHQEAQQKAADCADLGPDALRWHFIGGLQSNKAAAVASYAHVVESVDRPKLVGPLARGAEQRGDGSVVDCLLQVSLDPAAGSGARSGVAPGDLPALAERVAEASSLRLRGLMAVAPLGEEPRAAFERLAGIAEDLRRRHPEAVLLSAGMSADLEEAIGCGATHVRVGRAVLGPRPSVQ